MITAAQQGRDLAITVEGIESPFVIRPLPGRMGKTLTDLYFRTIIRELPVTQMEDVLRIAVDGGQWVTGDDGERHLVPLPEEQQTVYNRCDDELSTGEAQDVLNPAFFWQTVLNFSGVKSYVEAGGGFEGLVKTQGFLAQTLGVSPLTTSPSGALETLIRLQASMSPTTSPTGGSTIDRLPAGKQSRKGKRSK